MPDSLDRTSIIAPPQKVRRLAFGWSLSRDPEITYHFYRVNDDPYAEMRTARAVHKLRSLGAESIELDETQRENLVSNVLLGFLASRNVRHTIAKGNAPEVVAQAVKEGRLSGDFPILLEEFDLPFRESPLAGKTITQIASNPNAIAVFVVLVTKPSAPVAFLVLPFGIVALHVATRAAPRIAQWVDDQLKRILTPS